MNNNICDILISVHVAWSYRSGKTEDSALYEVIPNRNNSRIFCDR